MARENLAWIIGIYIGGALIAAILAGYFIEDTARPDDWTAVPPGPDPNAVLRGIIPPLWPVFLFAASFFIPLWGAEKLGAITRALAQKG